MDVLWADIQWADDKMYFQFDPRGFTEAGLEDMYDEVYESGRRLTLIFDPHIKAT